MENKDQIQETANDQETIDWKDLYLRSCADMENLKKRVSKEKEEIASKTKIQMINSILDMDNDMNIALKSFSDVPEGIKLIMNKLKSFLESQGIKEIEVDKYDPENHEVISVIENGDGEKVHDVVSKGYKLGNKIIRYPKIILSK